MNTLSPVRPTWPTVPAANLARPELTPGGGVLRPAAGGLTPTATPATEGSFSSLLGRMVADVSNKQTQAAQAVAGLQSGQPIAVHQAVIAMEEASVSFQLMAEVRNRLLESYQELMRMQV